MSRLLQPIEHLPGIRSRFVDTPRLRVHCLESGAPDSSAVLFVHGNASSSTIWEEEMAALPPSFRGIAPDLRGFGLTSDEAIIDATRGVGDWRDDLYAFLDSLKIERCQVVGHSMGGMISLGLLADSRSAGRIESMTLAAPAPPCGFGGLRGPDAQPNNPDYSGSGAGLAYPSLIERIEKGEREITDPFFSPRAVMNRMFWKPPFRAEREEAILSALLQIHLGPQRYPGDAVVSSFWPGFAPGRFGPINAISGKYNCEAEDRILRQPVKPPLLCVLGDDDPVISDSSFSDAGFQGKAGFRPGWPGEEVFPPQPLRTQLLSFLDRYRACGGAVAIETIADCGHSAFIEKPQSFRRLFHRFLTDPQSLAPQPS